MARSRKYICGLSRTAVTVAVFLREWAALSGTDTIAKGSGKWHPWRPRSFAAPVQPFFSNVSAFSHLLPKRPQYRPQYFGDCLA